MEKAIYPTQLLSQQVQNQINLVLKIKINIGAKEFLHVLFAMVFYSKGNQLSS